MYSLGVGGLPVIDEDESLVGMISDRDIVIRVVAHGLDPVVMKVAEVMTVEVVSMSQEADLEEAVGLMVGRQVRRLPLVDPEGHAIGILSLADLATRLSERDLSQRLLRAVSSRTRLGD
jgi:CBS domain-containing protein